jgi:hypothetical protein
MALPLLVCAALERELDFPVDALVGLAGKQNRVAVTHIGMYVNAPRDNLAFDHVRAQLDANSATSAKRDERHPAWRSKVSRRWFG